MCTSENIKRFLDPGTQGHRFLENTTATFPMASQESSLAFKGRSIGGRVWVGGSPGGGVRSDLLAAGASARLDNRYLDGALLAISTHHSRLFVFNVGRLATLAVGLHVGWVLEHGSVGCTTSRAVRELDLLLGDAAVVGEESLGEFDRVAVILLDANGTAFVFGVFQLVRFLVALDLLTLHVEVVADDSLVHVAGARHAVAIGP